MVVIMRMPGSSAIRNGVCAMSLIVSASHGIAQAAGRSMDEVARAAKQVEEARKASVALPNGGELQSAVSPQTLAAIAAIKSNLG
jgi:hypothetical protein